MTGGLIIPAFVAGFLTFLAPCTLPLVPAFLGFVAGMPVSLSGNGGNGVIRRRIILNTILYIAGFSVVFILFGTLAGFGGGALFKYRILLSQIGGVVVIFFGLYLLGSLIPKVLDGKLGRFFAAEQRWHPTRLLVPGRAGSSFLLGVTFALGWTPCIGPILGAVLLLASRTATVWSGAFLLLVFSLGLAVPFLILAFLAGTAVRTVRRILPLTRVFSFIGGILLILVGVLLLMDDFGTLLGWGFGIFNFIPFHTLLNHL